MRFSKLILLAALCWSSSGFALDNSLKSQTRLYLPAGIKTVAEAAQYFISPHNYKVMYRGNAPGEAYRISQQTLPATMPRGSVMTVENALLTLIGNDQILIVDTEHKLISFGRRTEK